MNMHFFTGFPGFIANQLIKQLFQERIVTHVSAVVLSTEIEKAKLDAAQICERYPQCKIDLFEGDITLPDIGMDDEDFKKVVPNIHVLWHLAAIYDLAVSRDVAWKVNVHGTASVNEFAKKLPNLQRYMYFSTAHIAGRRDGVLRESELIRPLAFKNYYEETKFEAELRVEDLKAEIPITIVRPSIVRGHSVTGEICKFDGPYFFLNLIDSLKCSPFIPFIGSKTASINVVPVDYVARAAVYLCTVEEAVGKTYHLTDPNPHKVKDMFTMMAYELTGKKLSIRLPLSVTKKCLENLSLRKRLGVEYETVDYLNWPVVFDCQEAQRILAKADIRCPDFLQTMPMMVQFYKENKHRKELFVAIK